MRSNEEDVEVSNDKQVIHAIVDNSWKVKRGKQAEVKCEIQKKKELPEYVSQCTLNLISKN